MPLGWDVWFWKNLPGPKSITMPNFAAVSKGMSVQRINKLHYVTL